MLRSIALPLACTLALALPAQGQQAAPDGHPFRLGAVSEYSEPGHVIVLTPRAAPGAAEARGEELAERHGGELAAIVPLPSLDETCYVLRFSEDADTAGLSEAVMDEAGVLLAYPVQGFEIGPQSALERQGAEVSPFADEPLLGIQDALRAMRVEEAHARVSGRGVRVALIDSGVAAAHPDLADQALTVLDFVGGDGSRERHGTAMAAMIAADGRNGVGMVGVAPDIELQALRGCWEEGGAGRCNTFSLALALDHAVESGAHVVNLSLGGPSDRLLEALVGRLIERGALVVAASGAAPFPAGVEGVLVVDEAETVGSGAGRLRAPGLDVLGAEPSGGYDFFTGSSVAAVHATGVAALLWSAAPEAQADEIERALAASGEALDACEALGAVTGEAICR